MSKERSIEVEDLTRTDLEFDDDPPVGDGGSKLSPNTPEPPPKPVDGPAVWDLVMADMRERDSIGKEKYGQRLTPGDGRDSLIDAYQESLDLVVYLRKHIEEQRASGTDAALRGMGLDLIELEEENSRLCAAVERLQSERDNLRTALASGTPLGETIANAGGDGKRRTRRLPECSDPGVTMMLAGQLKASAAKNAELLAEIERLREGPEVERLRGFVADVAKQECLDWAEGTEAGFDCSETSACVSEWCPPCRARALVRSGGGR